VPTLAGVAALLLFLALLASTAPGVHRRVKRQKEYAGSWEDVDVAECQPEPESATLKRSRTWGRMKRRMTGFYGSRQKDRGDEEYEERREKRKDRRRRVR
jgi:hypothetical protein